MKVTVKRRAYFNAAHRLYRPDWSDEKNSEVFGKCNNPNWHGHNYVLFVELTGDIDSETGYVVDLKWLSSLIKHEVIEKLDHKNLNLDVPELGGVNPTAENIAITIHSILRSKIDSKYDLKIVLQETENNIVECSD